MVKDVKLFVHQRAHLLDEMQVEYLSTAEAPDGDPHAPRVLLWCRSEDLDSARDADEAGISLSIADAKELARELERLVLIGEADA